MSDLSKVYSQEMALLLVCKDIEDRGILIDKPYVEACLRYEEMQRQKAIKSFEKDTGHAFLDSSKLFAKIFTERGESYPSTLKGNPSFTGDFLDKCDTPTAKLINNIRYHEKRITTYFKNFLYYADQNNIIHPSMNQSGTATGRFSYSSPNLQNCPKEDSEEDKNSISNIRKAFIPPDEYYILSIDYKAVEYRIMIDYAGEKALARAVMEGADVHQATADMLNISRKSAKTINFGCIAENELVLTNNGHKFIQDVLNTDLVWDGSTFRNHQGVVFNGIKEVITHSGVTATKCHRVFTERGFITIEEAKQKKLQILKGKYKRKSFWVFRSKNHSLQEISVSCCNSLLSLLPEKIYYTLIKLNLWKNKRLSLWKKFKHKTFIKSMCQKFKRSFLGGAYKMHIEQCKRMEKLRRKRDKIQSYMGGIFGLLYEKLHRTTTNVFRFRPNKQRWSLRIIKYKICNKIGKLKKQKIVKVYDILNVDCTNRFTVNGRIVHNCLYGIGINSLAKQLNTTQEEAKKIRQEYFQKLPAINKFLRDVKRTAEDRGYIRNMYGRRFYCADYRFSYKLANHLIQGTSADVIKHAMVKLHELLKNKKTRMVLQVHDELMFYLHKDEEDLVPRIKEVMESVYPSMEGMRLEVSISRSHDSWSHWDLQ